MNYRHAYHAGNFADVLKHVVLTLVIEHLKKKPVPFRIIDTHAGPGLYDLAGAEAGKTGEWRHGIGRLAEARLASDLADSLAPYLDAVTHTNRPGSLARYPGSPLIARTLLRPGDRLVANELHPEDFTRLADLFRGDRQTRALNLDGWIALKSLLPPREHRGLVLIDPPFEEAGEFDRLAEGLAKAMHRFATGTYLLWYPLKDLGAAKRFEKRLAALGIDKLLIVTLDVGPLTANEALSGCGLVAVNPPHTLEASLKTLLPALVSVLARGERGAHRISRLESTTSRHLSTRPRKTS